MKNTAVKNTKKNWIIVIVFTIAMIANNVIGDYKYIREHQEMNDDQELELAKRNMGRAIIHCVVAAILHHTVMDK